GTPPDPCRSTTRGTSAASPRARAAAGGCHRGRRCSGSARGSRCQPSHSPAIEVAALTGAVYLKGSLGAHRVRALEDPVLPRREAAEDLALERLRPSETQRGFHARQGVG